MGTFSLGEDSIFSLSARDAYKYSWNKFHTKEDFVGFRESKH